ncbi:MAG: DUF2244 domain-containing protein [Burkholderiaceae bacterium]
MAPTLSAQFIGRQAMAHGSRFGLRFGQESPGQSNTRQDWSVRWQLSRHCSLAPRQLLLCYLGLCFLSLAIAAGFWSVGALMVLPYAGVELLAVGLALFIYARHAADSESIRLGAGRLVVECAFGRRVERVEFAPAWVRIEPEHGDRSLVELSGQGRKISVGRFVRPELRREFAEELRWALRRWSYGGALNGSV